MRKKFSILVFVAASLAGVPHAIASEEPPVPIAEHQADLPINLNNVASISYRPAESLYEEWRAVPPSHEPEFALHVGQDSRPTHCEVIGTGIPDALGMSLCADLVEKATIRIAQGYSLGNREGLVWVNKRPVTQFVGIKLKDGTTPSPFSFMLTPLPPGEYLNYAELTDEERKGVKDDPTRLVPPEVTPVYPRNAMLKGFEGTTRILMQVGNDGAVVSCRPFETSGTASLDAAACKYAIKFLDFEFTEPVDPADAPFYHALPITWRLNS